MAEEPKGKDAEGKENDPKPGERDGPYWKEQAEKAFAARDKAKAEREETAAKLKDIESRQSAATKAKLVEEGKLQEALTIAQRESEETRRLAEEAAAKIKGAVDERDRYSGALEAHVKSQIERIPEEKRTLIPEDLDPVQRLAYIDRNRNHLFDGKPPPKAPPQGAGAGEVLTPSSFEAFMKMSGTEMIALRNKDPDLYRKFVALKRDAANRARLEGMKGTSPQT